MTEEELGRQCTAAYQYLYRCLKTRALFLSLSLHIHIYTYMYIHIYIYIYVHSHTYIYARTTVCRRPYTFSSIYLSMYICITSIFISIYRYVFLSLPPDANTVPNDQNGTRTTVCRSPPISELK